MGGEVEMNPVRVWEKMVFCADRMSRGGGELKVEVALQAAFTVLSEECFLKDMDAYGTPGKTNDFLNILDYYATRGSRSHD